MRIRVVCLTMVIGARDATQPFKELPEFKEVAHTIYTAIAACAIWWIMIMGRFLAHV
jgi:hypothetical protein